MSERLGWLLATREGLLTLAFFAGLFGAGIAEIVAPLRREAPGLGRRWITNFLLSFTGIALGAVVVPWLGRPGSAAMADLWSGLMGVSAVGMLVVGVLLADFLRYWIHRAFHLAPWLWRLHAVHHADVDLDVSTSFRHHPGEYLAVAATLIVAESLLAMPRPALAAYAVLMLLWTPLVHANVALPRALDRWLGMVLVTPGFHAVHHSTDPREGNANFGMVFSIWDRLFATALPRSTDQVERLRFGVAGIDASRSTSLPAMLLLPLSKPTV